MIFRKLNFLSPHRGYRKIEITIHENRSLCAVYLENKGYSIFIKGNEKEMFLINSDIAPDDFKNEKNKQDKEEFINLIKILLDEIYLNLDIQEYEREHHEFVFLKIMNLFGTDLVEILDDESDLYKQIELGFIKFDIDLLNMDVNNQPTINPNTDEENSTLKNISNSIDDSIKEFKNKHLNKEEE